MRKISILLLIFPLLFGATGCGAKKSMSEKVVFQENKIIPKSILEEAKTALSYYPELKDVRIEFKFKEDIKK